jgi:uncharacterized Tic20 family protein
MFAEATHKVSDEFQPFPADAEAPRVVDEGASPSDRTYATLMHLMLVIATFTAVPLILGPLIMWLIKKDESPFLNDHGKEALNFNISIFLYMIIAAVSFLCGIGVVLLPVVWVFGLVVSVLAAMSANRGEYYRYPACIRIIA